MRLFRSAPTSLLTILLLVLSSASSLAAEEARGRALTENHLLEGSYSFVLHGNATSSDQAYAASGVLTFDGAGNITAGSGRFVVNSVVTSGDLLTDQPNTYIVNADGSGTLRVFFAATAGFGLRMTIGITDSGRRIYLNVIGARSPITFEDIPGPTATGEAAKQK